MLSRFPQRRIISFNTHSLLVNDPSDWIYMLIPRGNNQMIIHRMTIHLLYFHSNQIGGRKTLWKNGGSIRCPLTRS